MASPTGQAVCVPLAFSSSLSAFTACFHFFQQSSKGQLCYKSIFHFCLLLPFAHIPNQFSVGSADQAHFVGKAFLQSCELWGHGAWAETRQLFLFLHNWFQLKLDRKPYWGRIRVCFPVYAWTRLLSTCPQWQLELLLGKQNKTKQNLGFFLVSPLHFSTFENSTAWC